MHTYNMVGLSTIIVLQVCTMPYMVGLSKIMLYKCVPYHIWLASAKLCFTSVYHTIYGWPQ